MLPIALEHGGNLVGDQLKVEVVLCSDTPLVRGVEAWIPAFKAPI
jgi:hypothetical protein